MDFVLCKLYYRVGLLMSRWDMRMFAVVELQNQSLVAVSE